jgi:hypothetical protein
MTEQKGFWSERPRTGADDARLLAAERLHDLRHRGYDELRARADDAAEVEDLTGLSGARFRRRTAIRRLDRRDGEELYIVVQVYRPSLLGRLNPLAEERVAATPDGEMIGDYTMAAEGNDPRRYRFRGR